MLKQGTVQVAIDYPIDAKNSSNQELKKTSNQKKALFSLENRLNHLSS